MNQAIGIDLGGTRIKGALVNTDTGAILQQRITPTHDGDTNDWKAAVVQTVQALKSLANGPIQGVGLSAPGLPNANNSAIAYLPNRLPGLENLVWADLLNERVWVLNDAHAALMAEARFGAARSAANAAMLTLGTGVGGGLLVNGQLYQGFFQMAGHLGHLTVDADSDQPSIVNMPGSLEDAIGNATVNRRTFGRYQSTHELIKAYRIGEPLATQVWLTSVRRLAVGIASIVNSFSPEMVILGGGIIQADDALFTPLNTFMDLFEWRPGGKKTPIVKAYFDEWAGAVGAGSYFTK